MKFAKSTPIPFVAISLLVAIQGCSSTGTEKHTESHLGEPAAKTANASGTVYHLQLHKVYDSDQTGKLVCSFLMPEGWKSTDFVKWIPGDYLTRVVGSSSLTSPDGELRFDTMSGLEKNFSRAPAGNSGELPPKSLSSYLLSVWKKDHPGVSVDVVTLQDTPATMPMQPPQGMQAKMVKSLIEFHYRKGGKKYLVKTQATMFASQTVPAQTGFGQMYEGGWLVGDFYQISAPESRVPEAMKVAAIVLTSSRLDPHWFNLVSQVQQQISRETYGRIAEAGRISQIISQANNSISDSIMSSYSTSQAAEDKSNQNFDDYIKGVDRYKDDGENVGLPSGYSHAWKSDSGDSLVSDDHLYNPNESNQGGSWHELEKAP